MKNTDRALLATALLAAVSVGCAQSTNVTPAPSPVSAQGSLVPSPIPAAPPDRWLGLIGEYDEKGRTWYVAEREGHLAIGDSAGRFTPLTEHGASMFALEEPLGPHDHSGTNVLIFTRDADGRATAMKWGDRTLARRNIEPRAGTNQLRVVPVRPVAELRTEALAASPPAEPAAARAPELVELVTLDPTIRLEVRYATTNNFLGEKFYDQGRAFMQRPAAEALVRANRSLRSVGYGLLVHDAYRPWYVTKMFWDATPVDKHWLVANPAEGSKHNRGSAVDLTLYDLATGQPVEMPSTYDESTQRAYADYPGGTSRQHWYRALLRRAMEAQGFIQNPQEWWHYDYRSWRDYPIGNVTFDKIR